MNKKWDNGWKSVLKRISQGILGFYSFIISAKSVKFNTFKYFYEDKIHYYVIYNDKSSSENTF